MVLELCPLDLRGALGGETLSGERCQTLGVEEKYVLSWGLGQVQQLQFHLQSGPQLRPLRQVASIALRQAS
eukprot:3248214-Pyramimonas_sp.AAC.1